MGLLLSRQKTDTPINLGYLTGAQSMPMLLAREKGMFKEAGLNVHVVDLSRNWGSQVSLLGSKVLDCSNSTKFYVVSGAAKDIPIRVLTSLATREGNPVAITIAKKDSPIKTFADVKGKTFGFRKGGSTEFVVTKLLEKHGMTLNDIKIVELSDAEAMAAFRTGKIDVYNADILTIEEIRGSMDVTVLADSSDVMPNSFSDAVVCREDFIKEHPAEVRKLMEVLYAAAREINTNPAGMKALLKTLKFSETWQKITFPVYATDPAYSADGIDVISDWFLSTGAIKKRVAANDVVRSLK